ncbi:MAG: HlyC/CorC family transporter [Treponema sp.]|nr:HlyC/CorC family transporter [Treponema sp.]MBQ6566016.1 HlyC/CorC family transporter [Treponema sp.]
MDAERLSYIIAVPVLELVLISFGAFFASTETGYTALSRITVRQMLKAREKNATLVSRLRANLDSLISTALIGTNLVTTLISSVATAYAMEVFGAACVSYATALVSVLVIIFSEIIPKTYAALRPKETAVMSARPIAVIQKLLFPVVWLFGGLSRLINFVEGRLIKERRPLVTEEELRTLLDVGKDEGTLEAVETQMLVRLFDFSDLRVRDIMRHRSFVKYVPVDAAYSDVIRLFNSGYSRLPVWKGSPETIVGVLHYKSVLFAHKEITESRDFVKICMKKAVVLPETLTALEALKRFKEEKDSFAIVLDEYGSNAGIVTMDDILSAVFGRLTDENGDSETAPEKRITPVSPYEYIVPGDMKLDDFNDIMKMDLDSESFETLGGWLLEKFGELPRVGAAWRDKGAVYIVEDQGGRRIISVRVKIGRH